MGNQRKVSQLITFIETFDTFTLNAEMVFQSMNDCFEWVLNKKPGWNSVEGGIYFITQIPGIQLYNFDTSE